MFIDVCMVKEKWIESIHNYDEACDYFYEEIILG